MSVLRPSPSSATNSTTSPTKSTAPSYAKATGISKSTLPDHLTPTSPAPSLIPISSTTAASSRNQSSSSIRSPYSRPEPTKIKSNKTKANGTAAGSNGPGARASGSKSPAAISREKKLPSDSARNERTSDEAIRGASSVLSKGDSGINEDNQATQLKSSVAAAPLSALAPSFSFHPSASTSISSSSSTPDLSPLAPSFEPSPHSSPVVELVPTSIKSRLSLDSVITADEFVPAASIGLGVDFPSLPTSLDVEVAPVAEVGEGKVVVEQEDPVKDEVAEEKSQLESIVTPEAAVVIEEEVAVEVIAVSVADVAVAAEEVKEEKEKTEELVNTVDAVSSTSIDAVSAGLIDATSEPISAFEPASIESNSISSLVDNVVPEPLTAEVVELLIESVFVEAPVAETLLPVVAAEVIVSDGAEETAADSTRVGDEVLEHGDESSPAVESVAEVVEAPLETTVVEAEQEEEIDVPDVAAQNVAELVEAPVEVAVEIVEVVVEVEEIAAVEEVVEVEKSEEESGDTTPTTEEDSDLVIVESATTIVSLEATPDVQSPILPPPIVTRGRASSSSSSNSSHSSRATLPVVITTSPSLTVAILTAWNSTTWLQRVPAVFASVFINFGLPFINGVMLGKRSLFLHAPQC